MSIAEAFASIATGFGQSPYLDAVAVFPGDAVYDDGGSIVTPAAVVRQPVKVQFDAATQSMRLSESFRETDVRLLILNGPFVMDASARVEVVSGERAGLWSILSVQRDPAGVGYECRARKEG